MNNTLKVVNPAVGIIKHLFPHTFIKPKPMIYIAGKPILGHILDKMKAPEEYTISEFARISVKIL